MNCFQLNTLDEKAYELFKKVVYKQRLEKSCNYNFDIDAKKCVCAGVLLQYSFFSVLKMCKCRKFSIMIMGNHMMILDFILILHIRAIG